MTARGTLRAALVVALAGPAGIVPARALMAQARAAQSESLTERAARVRHLTEQGKWAEALAALGPLGADSAGHALAARLAVNAGLDALKAGDSARAATLWERAIREDASVREGPVDLATLELARGRRDLARAAAVAGLHASPGDARLLQLRAATITDTASYRAALDEARGAHARAPRDEGVAVDYAGLLAGSQRLAAAALYDTILRRRGATATAFLSASKFWEAGGRVDAAVAMIDSGLAHHPDDGQLWMARGRLAARQSHWPGAVAAYQRAEPLVADRATATRPLVDAELAAGDTAAADSVYRAALERAPDQVWALDGAAELAAARADTARAVALYQRELAGDSGMPWAPLALLHLTRPAPARARQLLQATEWRAIAALQGVELAGRSSSPADAGAATEQGRFRVRLETLVRAVLDTVVLQTSWGPEELVQLERSYPGSPLIARYGAELADRRGQDSAALADYARLVTEAPADTGIQRDYAVLLERLGRPHDATETWTRLLDLAPEDTSAFRALVRLREPDGSLEILLAQVRRLRLRRPKSRLLGQHEVELLQRLGRLLEAAGVAKQLEGKPS